MTITKSKLQNHINMKTRTTFPDERRDSPHWPLKHSSLGTAAWADTITGSMAAAPASVNLNLSAAYAFYGIGGSFTPATDPSNVGNFSTLVAVGGYTGTGSDATYNLVTYNNGTTSATLSPNYSLAQDLSGGSSSATVSITTTLFATNEYLSVYVFGYDNAPDFSATVGSAGFALTNVVLPTTGDGNGTGEGHTFGVLKLAVNGTVGETLTITEATDITGVSGGNGFATVGISSVTAGNSTNAITGVAPVPNPPTISPLGGIVAGTNVTLTEILLPQVSNPPYTYQWQSNSVNIGTSVTSNSSTNVFSIDTTGFAVGSYNYQVVVTNSIGSATSAPVVLNIVTLAPLPGTSLIPTVWWEANATNNIINNGAVDQLTDQSGHENNAVQDAQNGTPMPLIVSNAVNGLPTLSFGGTNSLISPIGATTGNSSHSIFIVASYTPLAGQFENGAVFYSDTAGVDQNSCLGVNPNGNTVWVGGYGQDNAPYVGSITLNGAGFNILGKIYTASSANYQGFVAGVQDVNASGDTYNLGDTRVGLGKQYNNGSYWAGDIAEVIVFNTALNYSDIQAVQHYLASKYNLPLALPAISVAAPMPFAGVGSNVVVTVTLPVLTTTTTVTITSDNPSVTGFSSTNLTFTLGATNVQTFNVNILAAGTADLTASSSSYNNGTLAVGGLSPATLIEDYQASSLTSLNGGAAVNNGDSITAWAGEINNSWIWQLNVGADPTFLAQGTPALTPAIDFQGGSLYMPGGTSGLVAGRNNFSVVLVFEADAAGVGASGTPWGSQTGIIDDTPIGSFSGNDFGISISGSGEISAGLGGTSTSTISDINYNLVTSTYHVAVASYDTLNGQMSLTVDDQPTVASSSPISSGIMADNDIMLGGSSYEALTRYFSGAIAEVRFYNGALTVAQATNLIYTLKSNYSILYPSEVSVSLTPANATVFGTNNAILTLTIPQVANASHAVTVTVTNNNPSVVSLQGAVGNVLTVTFPAGATNVQPVVVTGVAGGQASLTYASSGLVAAGPATINVVFGLNVTQITGGDPGEGFAPLPTDVAGVTFDSSSVTIQGVTFVQHQDGQTGEGGIDSTGVFPVNQPFGFGSTPDDNSMATLLSGSTYAYTGNTQYSPPITSPDQYVQYQFTGLTNGQTYQVDIFTVCDAIPRPTLAQVVGATTNAYIVETETSPQDVVFDMTPDTNGDITIQWTFGSGPYDVGSNGNSGCVSGIALTTNPNLLGIAQSGSSLILTWSSGGTLLQATNLPGPWTTNVNTSPYMFTPTGPQMFFRVQNP